MKVLTLEEHGGPLVQCSPIPHGSCAIVEKDWTKLMYAFLPPQKCTWAPNRLPHGFWGPWRLLSLGQELGCQDVQSTIHCLAWSETLSPVHYTPERAVTMTHTHRVRQSFHGVDNIVLIVDIHSVGNRGSSYGDSRGYTWGEGRRTCKSLRKFSWTLWRRPLAKKQCMFCFVGVCFVFPSSKWVKGKPQDPKKQNMGSEILETWL